jgi:hypothetical protein
MPLFRWLMVIDGFYSQNGRGVCVEGQNLSAQCVCDFAQWLTNTSRWRQFYTSTNQLQGVCCPTLDHACSPS